MERFVRPTREVIILNISTGFVARGMLVGCDDAGKGLCARALKCLNIRRDESVWCVVRVRIRTLCRALRRYALDRGYIYGNPYIRAARQRVHAGRSKRVVRAEASRGQRARARSHARDEEAYFINLNSEREP